jgi:xanthine dehydrogenase molybdopterin-binding subunit B
VTTEEFKVASDGRIITRGPLNYKIPTIRNIPRQLKVSLLKESMKEKAVYSSKVRS